MPSAPIPPSLNILNFLAGLLAILSVTLLASGNAASSDPLKDVDNVAHYVTGTFNSIDQGEPIVIKHKDGSSSTCTVAYVDKEHRRLWTAAHCGDEGDRVVQGTREYGTFHPAFRVLGLHRYEIPYKQAMAMSESDRRVEINRSFDAAFINIDDGAETALGSNPVAPKVYEGSQWDILSSDRRVCIISRVRGGVKNCGLVTALSTHNLPNDNKSLSRFYRTFYRDPSLTSSLDSDLEPDYRNQGENNPLTYETVTHKNYTSDIINDPIVGDPNRWAHGVGYDDTPWTHYGDEKLEKLSATLPGDSGSALFDDETGEVLGILYGSRSSGGINEFSPLGWWKRVVEENTTR